MTKSGRTRGERRKARQQQAAAHEANDPAKSPGAPVSEGGGGEISNSDAVLVRTAIQGDYPITPAIREKIVDRMDAVLDSGATERSKVAAAKVLIASDRHNAGQKPKQSLHLHQHQGGEVPVPTGGGKQCPTCGMLQYTPEERRQRIEEIRKKLKIRREALDAAIDRHPLPEPSGEPGVQVMFAKTSS